MSHMRKLAKAGIVSMALGAIVTGGSGIAQADPDNGAFRTYAAVGSDTTQAVWNGLTNGTNPAITGIASYDATPAGSNIQTSAGGPTYLRPTGSGNGVKALSAAYDPNNHVFAGTTLSPADVAFARSSSRPSVAGSDLTYLPFARDAVSVGINPFPTKSPKAFTTAQLKAIYGGADDNASGTGVSFDPDSGLPILNKKVLTPLLPQSGSGTRSFFLSAIGAPTLASYVNANSAIIENDGSALDQDGELIPFSAAQYIAQGNGVQTNTLGSTVLASVNGLAPVSGKPGQYTAGPLFGTKTNGKYSTPPTPGTGTFARDTYNVIPTSFLGSGATATQTTLVSKLTGKSTGQVGGKPAVAVISKFGFGNLSYLGDPSQYLSSGYVH